MAHRKTTVYIVKVILCLNKDNTATSLLFCSLLKQKFVVRNHELQTPQTPQFEGGNMNLVLFGFDTGDYNRISNLRIKFNLSYALAIDNTRLYGKWYTCIK